MHLRVSGLGYVFIPNATAAEAGLKAALCFFLFVFFLRYTKL